ncbi:MAG: Vgb family protein [Chloroflexota bacterium]
MNRVRRRLLVVCGALVTAWPVVSLAQDAPSPTAPKLQEYPVPIGEGPHDVWPAADGGVWYTAQRSGQLGWLDPSSGQTRQVALGPGSAPHGVIVGPDGAPWVTDGGLNAIVRVDPDAQAVQVFPLSGRNANLNTATFDASGKLWFTGQNGLYGRLDPNDGSIEAFEAPRGSGPYGMTTTPSGQVYYASLAGSHIARIDLSSKQAVPLDPPTARQGSRRIWSDGQGVLWISEWDAGQLGRYDPASTSWREWPLPGARPAPYAAYVDDLGMVWLSDWSANAFVRFDPVRETFEAFPFPTAGAAVRQIAGRTGEVWAAESGKDQLVVARTR